MSIFRTEELRCPGCGTPANFELVYSVNADRRPDLRDAILAGSFQRQTCARCGTDFRVEPEFTYIDVGRGQYIGAWPQAMRRRWKECAAQTRNAFDDAMGERATPEARAIGAGLTVRSVFGWEALVEKILARGMAVDDTTLELAKVTAMRHSEATPAPGRQALRLVGERDGDLLLAWVGGGAEDAPGTMRVPRELVDDIESDPAAWTEVRAMVAEGDVVDFQRNLLPA
jgi:hypothetical protein